MEQKNIEKSQKVKLVAIRSNDYANITIARHSQFPSERLRETEDTKNHWVVFTGTPDGDSYKAPINHGLILKEALLPEEGQDEPFLSPANRSAIYDRECYERRTAYANESGVDVKGLTSLVEAEDIAKIFPNATIFIASDAKDLDNAYKNVEGQDCDHAITQKARIQSLINAEKGGQKGRG